MIATILSYDKCYLFLNLEKDTNAIRKTTIVHIYRKQQTLSTETKSTSHNVIMFLQCLKDLILFF